MLEHKAVSRIVSLVLCLGFIASVDVAWQVRYAEEAFAQHERDPARKKRSARRTRKKAQTVGELFSDIEKRKAHSRRVMKKRRTEIPGVVSSMPVRKSKVNLSRIKPPQTRLLTEGADEDSVALEKMVDEEISQLYKLTKRYKNSSTRGELWIRLGELYVEKAKLIEFRLRDRYDAQIASWEKNKRRGRKPRLNLRAARQYNRKAIQLYEWFMRDFPKDRKADQALFFLGFNHFELGSVRKGEKAYKILTTKYRRSPYVYESHFALGEYYFENDQWKNALPHYEKIFKNKRARVYPFALYKSAWCLYRTGRTLKAMKRLEKVIAFSRSTSQATSDTGKGINRIRLAKEAVRDIVPFYADAGSYRDATSYFERIAGSKAVKPMLERLAYLYVDTGKREQARYSFKKLMQMDPYGPKNFEFQYQIVMAYYSGGSQKVFRNELYDWIKNYSPNSTWGKRNKDQTKKSDELRESVLRTYILQNHQSAEKSKTKTSRKLASDGYELYFRSFPKSAKVSDMHFFYGELLYDMKSYQKAAYHYEWVATKTPRSKFAEQSILNAVLALERTLPTVKTSSKSLTPVPLSESEKKFIMAGSKYIAMYPRGKKVAEIRFRIASIYYTHNQFDPALKAYKEIIDKHPKTKTASSSARIVLDIYNLKKDYDGLAKAGSMLLASPGLVSSGDVGDIKDVVQQAAFKKAQNLEVGKNYAGSAKQFQSFATKFPKSKLAPKAQYNSAINFERAGDLLAAASMYKLFLRKKPKSKSDRILRGRATRLLGKVYEQTGQYERAAIEYERFGQENPKDQFASASFYNAAVIWRGLKRNKRAVKTYNNYYKAERGPSRYSALYDMAEIERERGAGKSAMVYYQKFLRSPSRDNAKIIEAHIKMARLSKSPNWYKKTVGVQKRLSNGGLLGAPFAAEAAFELSLKAYRSALSIKIPSNPAKQKAAFENKAKKIADLAEELKLVIDYDVGEYIVASLVVLAKAWEDYHRAFYSVPIPKGLNAEQQKQYMDGIAKIAAPSKELATKNYKEALGKAFDLQGYTSWIPEAYMGLERFGEKEYVMRNEEASVVKQADLMGI
jgi:TolA-binding protein